MRDEPRTWARFPTVDTARGHYESFYLKASHPTEPLGVWIRYTVHRRPGAAQTGSLWFTFFDDTAAAGGVVASKVTLEDVGSGPDHYIRVGDARFEPGRVVGRALSEQLDAAWELSFDAGEAPLRHLPRAWMYRAPLPRTKVLTPNPAVNFRGRLTVGGRSVDVSGWPGMVGHNWGTEHAERSIWLHAAGFGELARAWLDVAIGRIRIGRLTTPWVANGALSLDGERHRLGGVTRVRGTRVDETPERCSFALAGKGIAVEGSAGAARRSFVSWIYADPGGSEHQTVNCSIADMELHVTRDGAPPLRLTARSGAAYELCMHERYEPIRPQPFGDGA